MRAMWTRFCKSLVVKRNLLIRCPPLWERSNPDVHTLGRMLYTGQLKKAGRFTPKDPLHTNKGRSPVAKNGKKCTPEGERREKRPLTQPNEPLQTSTPHSQPNEPLHTRKRPTQGREKANQGGERMHHQNTFSSSQSSKKLPCPEWIFP